MYINLDYVPIIVGVISIVSVLGGLALAIHRWVLRQENQSCELEKIHAELHINTKAVWACLKVLQEKGFEGGVTEAITELEEHLIKKGHNIK